MNTWVAIDVHWPKVLFDFVEDIAFRTTKHAGYFGMYAKGRLLVFAIVFHCLAEGAGFLEQFVGNSLR
jgi:hypothetical protein